MLGFPADLHIHSALSPCAEREMDPPHVFERAVQLGLEAVAITDHNSTANLPAFMEDPPNGLWVIPGMELQTKEEIHLICLFPSLEEAMAFGRAVDLHLPEFTGWSVKAVGEQTKLNHFGETVGNERKLLLNSTDLGLNEAFTLVFSFNGFAYPAHADRTAFGILGQLGFIPPDLPVMTLEVSYHLDQDACSKLFPGYQLVQSSDAHRLREIGRGCSLLKVNGLCWEELIMALKGQNGRKIEL